MASRRRGLRTGPFWLLLASPGLSARSGALLFFTGSSRSGSSLASFSGCAPSFLIVELKSRLVVSTAAPSASYVGSHRARFLVQSFSFCLLMTSLGICLGMPVPPCVLAIWPSGPLPRARLGPPLLSGPPSPSLGHGPAYGDFHSVQGGVGPPFSLRIPIGPLSGPDWASWASLFCLVPPLDFLG